MARAVFAPFMVIGRLLFPVTVVPAFRLVFFVRRHLSHLYLPAKNRALYLVSNRYVFHVAAIMIALAVSFMNVQASEVRADTFGEKSLLFGMVTQDRSATVEEVSADVVTPESQTNYDETYVVSVDDAVDVDTMTDDLATTLGGSDLIAPTISGEDTSVAARTATEKYTVQNGDTLGTIADQYGLNLASVLWANELTATSTIRPGDTLTIPPTNGVLYTVKKNDTLLSIAKQYNADADKIVAFNRLANADDLHLGDELMIPDGEPPKPVVRYTAPLAKIFTAPDTSDTNGGSGPSKAAVAGGWTWPTDWHVITQYYGVRGHTGVDLDGDYNTFNYASRAGTVVRASWYDGYGLCVDVDHGDGYMTRYGHFSKIFVNVGDHVDAGQALGHTGTTGRSTGTHLHFEVWLNGKRQNPLQYIR